MKHSNTNVLEYRNFNLNNHFVYGSLATTAGAFASASAAAAAAWLWLMRPSEPQHMEARELEVWWMGDGGGERIQGSCYSDYGISALI